MAEPRAEADIRLLCAGAMHRIMDDLVPAFSATAGKTVTVRFASSGGVKTRVAKGEPADVVITTLAAIDELAASGRVIKDSIRVVARSPIGVAVRAGAAKPDVITVEGFRRVLLQAETIAYADPATGSPSANHLVKVLERLGLTETLRARTSLIKAAPGSVVIVCEAVARGEAEIGIQQISEILGIEGVELAGPLPDELQHLTPFTAAIGAQAVDPEAARALIEFVTSPAAAASVESCGMRPG